MFKGHTIIAEIRAAFQKQQQHFFRQFFETEAAKPVFLWLLRHHVSVSDFFFSLPTISLTNLCLIKRTGQKTRNALTEQTTRRTSMMKKKLLVSFCLFFHQFHKKNLIPFFLLLWLFVCADDYEDAVCIHRISMHSTLLPIVWNVLTYHLCRKVSDLVSVLFLIPGNSFGYFFSFRFFFILQKFFLFSIHWSYGVSFFICWWWWWCCCFWMTLMLFPSFQWTIVSSHSSVYQWSITSCCLLCHHNHHHYQHTHDFILNQPVDSCIPLRIAKQIKDSATIVCIEKAKWKSNKKFSTLKKMFVRRPMNTSGFREYVKQMLRERKREKSVCRMNVRLFVWFVSMTIDRHQSSKSFFFTQIWWHFEWNSKIEYNFLSR